MLEDVQAGEAIFGIVLRQADGLASVGCTVRLLHVNSLPDGRSNIECLGQSRFRLIEVIEDDEAPYARAVIEAFDDDPGFEDDETSELFERLKELFGRLYSANRRLRGLADSDTDPELPDLPADEELFSYVLADNLAVDLALKQRWLELTSTPLRLREMESYLVEAAEAEERKVWVGKVSRTNGHGGKLPHG